MYKLTFLFVSIWITASCFSQKIFPYRQNNKWYFVDSTLKRLSPQSYTFVEPFQGSFALVYKSGKVGVINSSMKMIISPQTSQITIDHSHSQFVLFDKSKKVFKYFDYQGKRIEGTPMAYGCGTENIYDGRLFSVRDIGDKFRVYYYPTGQTLQVGRQSNLDSLPGLYDAYAICYNAIFLKIGEKWGAYGKDKEKKLDFIYDYLHPECLYGSLQYTIIMKDSLFGLVDDNLNITAETKYLKIEYPKYGFYLVTSQNGQKGYIDLKGREYFKD